MRCLVTGVAGFVGSTLAERLIADGHEVTGIDCFVDYYPRALKEENLKDLKKAPSFRFIEADLSSCDLVTLVKDVGWVFHQAAQAGVRASWGQSFDGYIHHNIASSQKLLEALKGSASLKKLVYASSSSVYGDAESFPTSELTRPQPVSPYGVTKLAAENLMVLYAKEFNVSTVSLRYFTVFGPRQRPDMAFHRFIRAGLSKQSLTLYGTGEQSRDFTFISDIVEANILAAEHGASGSVFNIGGGNQATVNQVLETLQAIIGNVKIQKESRQVGDAAHTSADIKRAKEQIKYSPKVTLQQGLEREVAYIESLLAKGL